MACNIYTFADFTEVCGNNSGGIKKVVMVASDAVGKSFFTYTKDDGTGDTNFNAPYNLRFATDNTTSASTFASNAVVFNVNRYASSMTSTGVYNDNGANLVNTEVTLTFNGLHELQNFDSLRVSHPFIFVQMTDGTWYNTGIVGLYNRATASTVQTGAQRTDAKNMSITYTEDSLYSPINVMPYSSTGTPTGYLAKALNEL